MEEYGLNEYNVLVVNFKLVIDLLYLYFILLYIYYFHFSSFCSVCHLFPSLPSISLSPSLLFVSLPRCGDLLRSPPLPSSPAVVQRETVCGGGGGCFLLSFNNPPTFSTFAPLPHPVPPPPRRLAQLFPPPHEGCHSYSPYHGD